MSRRLFPAPVVAAAVALALAGCGLGAGPVPSAVKLTVTREFGASVVGVWGAPKVAGQETVMSLLMRNTTVGTRYGGGFVQSIDGSSGGTKDGHPVAWFYYVNGVQAPLGAAETNVHPGDHIWWDWHDWSQAESIPAVVGSYPEPFLNGVDGKRYPVKVECAPGSERACRTVSGRLQAAGVPAAVASTGGGGAPETLRVAVGPWVDVGGESITSTIESGPQASGVYARFSSGGDRLALLNGDGSATRTFGAGAGLIAATSSGKAEPVWLVTGTNAAGVERAAEDFDEASLHNRFAVVISPQGAVLPAPSPGA